MGRKRDRARQLVYFCVAGLIILPLFGCTVYQKSYFSKNEVVEKVPEIEETKEETLPLKEPVEIVEKEAVEIVPPRDEVKDVPPPLKEESEKVKKSAEEEIPGSENLLKAKKLLELGDYEGSLVENQKVLSLPGQNTPGDQALFNIGLIYAHPGNTKKDYEKSVLFFKTLLKDYPQSSFSEEAKIWIEVLQENRKLIQMIEKSKEVDIAVEEKKREKER